MSSPANTPFTVVAEIRDPDGDVCANGEADVPCVISIDTYPSGSENAVLSGTLTKTPVAGVLTFDDLEIDTEGNGYTLKVEPVEEVDGLVAKVSGSFTIGGNTLTAVDLGGDTFGYVTLVGGSVSPADLGMGSAVRSLTVYDDGMGYVAAGITLSGIHTQTGTFISIVVGGVTYTAASADSFSGGNAWQWENQGNGIPSAGSYPVTVNLP